MILIIGSLAGLEIVMCSSNNYDAGIILRWKGLYIACLNSILTFAFPHDLNQFST